MHRCACVGMLVVMLVGLAGCVGINPDWQGDHGESETTDEVGSSESSTSESGSGASDEIDGDTSTSDASTTADYETDTGESDDGSLSCSEGAAAQGPCPPGCDCLAGECRILCLGEWCRDTVINCPPNWPCRIICAGKQACEGSLLSCSGAGTCAIDCVDEQACANTHVVCAEGPCSISCHHWQQPCDDMQVICGARDSEVDCGFGDPGTVPELIELPGSSCACTSDCLN